MATKKKATKGVLGQIGDAVAAGAEAVVDAGSQAIHAVGDLLPGGAEAPKKKSAVKKAATKAEEKVETAKTKAAPKAEVPAPKAKTSTNGNAEAKAKAEPEKKVAPKTGKASAAKPKAVEKDAESPKAKAAVKSAAKPKRAASKKG